MVRREDLVMHRPRLSVVERSLLESQRTLVDNDVTVIGDYHLEPGSYVSIKARLMKNPLYPFAFTVKNLSVYRRKSVFSTRSRGALVGLEFRPILSSDIAFDNESDPQTAILEFEAAVLGGRPIILKDDDRMGRFFNVSGAQQLTGSALVETIRASREIAVSGDYEVDWFLIDAKNNPVDWNRLNYATGIGLFLDNEEKYIPSAREPVRVFDDSVGDFRAVLDRDVLRVLPEILKGDINIFRIGQTRATVTLLRPYNGVLLSAIGRDVGVQIDSNLMEGGTPEKPITDWKLRVEYVINPHFFTPDKYYKKSIYVGLNFYRDRV